MFEKEAKKWVKENTRIEHSASFGEIKVYPSAENGFQAGAEFGYKLAHEEMDYLNKHWVSEEERKANEWHYPSKGELPTHDCMVLLHWESAIGSNTVITCWKNGKFLEPYNRKDITVAWQEIIPPKENE